MTEHHVNERPTIVLNANREFWRRVKAREDVRLLALLAGVSRDA